MRCGRGLVEGDAFCPSCGTPIHSDRVPAYLPTPLPTRHPTPSGRKERPTGVTVVAVLKIIGGIMSSLLVDLGALGPVLGGIALIMGIFSFVLAYGLLKGRSWAWTVTFIFTAIGILVGLVSLPFGLIDLTINVMIIYYLTRAHIKEFFGKAPPPSLCV